MKERIWKYCVEIIQEKAADIQAQLEDLRRGAESEGKSTAGDKHETGRAMMHLEQEQLQKQLGEFQIQLQQLHSLRQVSSTPTIQNGSLVTTDQGLFYLSIGLGKLTLEELPLFVISPASPIGKAFLGKKINEVVTFGAAKYWVIACA